MTKEEQKAKELIEKYKEYAYSITQSEPDLFEKILVHNSKQCAILECQSFIDELELNNDGDVNFVGSLDERITFYKGVIKAIEQQ